MLMPPADLISAWPLVSRNVCSRSKAGSAMMQPERLLGEPLSQKWNSAFCARAATGNAEAKAASARYLPMVMGLIPPVASRCLATLHRPDRAVSRHGAATHRRGPRSRRPRVAPPRTARAETALHLPRTAPAPYCAPD